MPTKDEVFEKIQVALVDALGVDEEDVTPEATLVGDLGAESIDFLDIVFRLEKAFDIKIPRGELFPRIFSPTRSTCKTGRSPSKGCRAPPADAVRQSRQLRPESRGARLRQPVDRGRHVPLRGEQGRGDRIGVSVKNPLTNCTRWEMKRCFLGSRVSPGFPHGLQTTVAHAAVRRVGVMRWYWIDRFIEFEAAAAPRPSRIFPWPRTICTTTFPIARSFRPRW